MKFKDVKNLLEASELFSLIRVNEEKRLFSLTYLDSEELQMDVTYEINEENNSQSVTFNIVMPNKAFKGPALKKEMKKWGTSFSVPSVCVVTIIGLNKCLVVTQIDQSPDKMIEVLKSFKEDFIPILLQYHNRVIRKGYKTEEIERTSSLNEIGNLLKGKSYISPDSVGIDYDQLTLHYDYIDTDDFANVENYLHYDPSCESYALTSLLNIKSKFSDRKLLRKALQEWALKYNPKGEGYFDVFESFIAVNQHTEKDDYHQAIKLIESIHKELLPIIRKYIK